MHCPEFGLNIMEHKSAYKFIPMGMNLEQYHRSRKAKADMVVNVIEEQCGDLSAKIALDIGCHDGSMTKFMATAFRNITGVDTDLVIIELAKQHHHAENLTFVGNDTSRLPFDDNSFDVVVGNHVLYYVEDIQAFLNELDRVLKPGGLFYLSVLNGFYTKLISIAPSFSRKYLANILLRSSLNYGQPQTYKNYCSSFGQFHFEDITYNILRDPKKYSQDTSGWQQLILTLVSLLPDAAIRFITKLSPTFIFLLNSDKAQI